MAYDRDKAVSYAHAWALRRNPRYYDYERFGGDCTSFVSQCLFAGFGAMDFGRNGWYYKNANDKSPSWTGVQFLYSYLTRESAGTGPRAAGATPEKLRPGDIVQLSFDGASFSHSLLVVELSSAGIYIAAHSVDCDYRSIGSYDFAAARGLSVLG
jgi:hypothetical protein